MTLKLQRLVMFAVTGLSLSLLFTLGSVSTFGQTNPTPSPTPVPSASPSTPTPSSTPPTEIQCNESNEKAKECIDIIVKQLRSMKVASEDYVGLLKADNKGTAALKTKYTQLKTRTDAVITLLTRSNPQFNQLKAALNSATTAYNSFINDANIALEGAPPAAAFPLNYFANLFFENICSFVPNLIGATVCKVVVDYVRTLRLKATTSLRRWDSIKALG